MASTNTASSSTCLNCSGKGDVENMNDFLLRKLRFYSNENTKLNEHIIEMQKFHDELRREQESSTKKFLDHLKFLEHKAQVDSTELIKIMYENMKMFYKCCFILNFDDHYGQNINTIMQSLIGKLVEKEQDDLSRFTESRVSTISSELSDFREKTNSLREKLNQQNKLLKNLCEKFPQTNSEDPAHTPFTSVTSTSSDNTVASSSQDDLYTCPNCLTSIDSSKITMKKFESHVKKCDSNKLCCMFCFKLYDKSEHVLLENHVQKHIIKQSLSKSPTTTVSIMKKLNCSNGNQDAMNISTSNSSSRDASFLLNDSNNGLDQTAPSSAVSSPVASNYYIKLNDTIDSVKQY